MFSGRVIPYHDNPRSKASSRNNEVCQAMIFPTRMQFHERARRDTFHRLAAEILSRPIGPCVALDCEMVGIGEDGLDSALARVSMVDWEGNVLLDTFVHVPAPVTDYRTYVSGVTASDLESNQAIYLEDCQYLVQTILRGRVLIGHALVNDLSALNLTHPWHDIRDTATYVPFMQVYNTDNAKHGRELRARKLSELVREKLGKTIQQIGEGHSSIEDARAALDLYKVVRNEWETLISWKVKKAERQHESIPAYNGHHYSPHSPDSPPRHNADKFHPHAHLVPLPLVDDRTGRNWIRSFHGYSKTYRTGVRVYPRIPHDVRASPTGVSRYQHTPPQTKGFHRQISEYQYSLHVTSV